MEPQTKRTVLATILCIGILFGWMKYIEYRYPPAPPQATSAPGEVELAPAASAPDSRGEHAVAPKASAPAAQGLYSASIDPSAKPVMIGDARQSAADGTRRNPFEMAVVVAPNGAGVESIRLSRFRNSVPKDKRHPNEDPYDLVQGVRNPVSGQTERSFLTDRILLVDDDQMVNLADVAWSLVKTQDERGEVATLSTTIQKGPESVLRLTKRFRVERDSPHLLISLSIENLTRRPLKMVVTERGALGFRNEDPQRESRQLVSTLIDEAGAVTGGEVDTRAKVIKENFRRDLNPGEQRKTFWLSNGNKYFSCIQSWLPATGKRGEPAKYFAKAAARVCVEDAQFGSDLSQPGDLTYEQVLSWPAGLQPGQIVKAESEVYCGPKSDTAFAALPAEYQVLHYPRASEPDRSGCTFEILTRVMLWLLTRLNALVGNYGVAIIILTFIVRTVLHPVTKRGQVSMTKMQKSMAQIKPKIELLQQQYKNDKQKLQEETMKLYREEGVNPAGSMLGCLPMFLQMPVWVALWTTLNTNVDMRHQPFFWWIRDLSVPDGFYTPEPLWNLHIPLLGAMTGTIHAFNLLPILMTITMYAQAKVTQKLVKPATPPKPTLDAEGNPVPDQMAQQQKMMNFMMIFFGLMLYNFPSGLSLYILSSNLLGMVEQWRIRKHIKDKDDRGDFALKKPDGDTAKRPGFFERLQKAAEQTKAGRGRDKPKRRKQPRF